MRRSYRAWIVWGSTALIGGALLTAAMEKAAAREGRSGKQVSVVMDPTPPDRTQGMATSYAPMVKETAPAVVNIFTTKTVQRTRSQSWGPMLEDPLFRRFFGDRFNRDTPRQPRELKQRSLGSGVVVTEDGYILTNDHVVDGADEIRVAFADSKRQYDAEIVGGDPQTDIAILKIEADALPHAIFGDSDHVEVGDIVLAVGNPFGIGQTVTMGIVSAVGRGGMGIEDYEDFIQTDAAINPGNSGGALVDTHGRLVGLNTAILSRTGGNHGVGFAIPANLVRLVMDQLIEDGEVQRGFLGVNIQDLSQELAEEFGLEDNHGALVAEVTEDSAAADAGVKRGDVIVEFNGKPVKDSRSLRVMVGHVQPGTEVELVVSRDGKDRTLTAKLKALSGLQQLGSSRPDRDSSGLMEDEGALRGVRVGDLSDELRQQFELPEELEGVVIMAVDPDSEAYEQGLRPGDVILEIDRQRVRSAEEAMEACRASRDGTTLVNLVRDGIHRFVVIREDLDK